MSRQYIINQLVLNLSSEIEEEIDEGFQDDSLKKLNKALKEYRDETNLKDE